MINNWRLAIIESIKQRTGIDLRGTSVKELNMIVSIASSINDGATNDDIKKIIDFINIQSPMHMVFYSDSCLKQYCRVVNMCTDIDVAFRISNTLISHIDSKAKLDAVNELYKRNVINMHVDYKISKLLDMGITDYRIIETILKNHISFQSIDYICRQYGILLGSDIVLSYRYKEIVAIEEVCKIFKDTPHKQFELLFDNTIGINIRLTLLDKYTNLEPVLLTINTLGLLDGLDERTNGDIHKLISELDKIHSKIVNVIRWFKI